MMAAACGRFHSILRCLNLLKMCFFSYKLIPRLGIML